MLFLANLVRLVPVAVIAVLIARRRQGGRRSSSSCWSRSASTASCWPRCRRLCRTWSPRRELVLANSLTPTSGTIAFTIGLGLASVLRAALAVRRAGRRDRADLRRRIPGRGPARAADAGRSARARTDDAAPAPVRAALGGVVRGLVDGLRHLRRARSAARALTVIAAHRFCYGAHHRVHRAALPQLLPRLHRHRRRPVRSRARRSLVSGLGFLTAAVVTPGRDRADHARSAGSSILLALAAVVELVPGALFTEWGMLVAAFWLGLVGPGRQDLRRHAGAARGRRRVPRPGVLAVRRDLQRGLRRRGGGRRAGHPRRRQVRAAAGRLCLGVRG